jgi:hypothetical protein
LGSSSWVSHYIIGKQIFSTCQIANVLPQAETALLVKLLALVDGLTLPISLLVPTADHHLLERAGTQTYPLRLSTAMHMVIQAPVAAVVDQEVDLLVVEALDSGEMENTSQVLLIHAKSENFSA